MLGPDRDWTKGKVRRLRIRVPSLYLELTPEQSREEIIEAGQFTLAIQFPLGTPVPRYALGTKDVLLITASWDAGNGVQQRIDGTWHNHFSRYSRRLADSLGMHQFGTRDSFDDSRLYVSPDQKVLIECQHITGRKQMPCLLMSNDGGHLTVQTRFDHALLDKWQDVLFLSRRMMSDVTEMEER